MKTQGIYLIGLLFFIFACGPQEPPVDTPGNTSPPDDSSLATVVPSFENLNAERARPNCPLPESVLAGNVNWNHDASVLSVILPDSSDNGAAADYPHRRLQVIRVEDCSLADEVILPHGKYPEFPFYLAEIIYNTTSRLLGVKGFDQIYCYDLEEGQLLPPLDPAFLQERFPGDAQSGMIQRLEVWEKYLIGYAQDMGVFAFDLSDSGNPKPILALAEYNITNGQYQSLFIVPSLPNGNSQIITPEYDPNTGALRVNPLLDKPMDIEPIAYPWDGSTRYVAIQMVSSGEYLLADLKEKALVDWPDELDGAGEDAILDWLEANR
jgi:hypothetical protein